jgi:hypothetical protein
MDRDDLIRRAQALSGDQQQMMLAWLLNFGTDFAELEKGLNCAEKHMQAVKDLGVMMGILPKEDGE